MSPKDEGHVFGLCGKFDNSQTGDLLHSDGSTVSSPGNWFNGPLDFVKSWTYVNILLSAKLLVISLRILFISLNLYTF